MLPEIEVNVHIHSKYVNDVPDSFPESNAEQNSSLEFLPRYLILRQQIEH